MTKEEQAKLNGEEETQQTPPPEVAEKRPNRDAFSKRFSKRHSDIDFEDKEARYGAMNDDADMLSQYEESGKALSGILDKHKWFAAALMKMNQNPDMNPVEVMASFGVDIQAALEDPEEAKKVAELITKHQESVAEQEKHEQEVLKNMRKSREVLNKLYPDEASDMWKQLFDILGEAEDGNVPEDVWKMLHNSNSYDSDIASAREEAAMQARNEKIQNPVRSSKSESIPPSLASSGNGNKPAQPKKQKRESFFDGLDY